MLLVKIGGSVMGNIENILPELPEEKMIVVHGGGKDVTEIAEKLGKRQRWIVSPQGQRSRRTDRETMEIFQMVLAGKINKDIVRSLSRCGRKSVGLCGIDMNLIEAERKRTLVVKEGDKKMAVDGGYTGRITRINSGFLKDLLTKNIIPVIAPVAISREHEALNVDADRVAAAISSSMEIDEIIFITDVDGVLDSDGRTIERIRRSDLDKIKAGFGMQKKIMGILESRAGKITITNGLSEEPLSPRTVIE